MIINKKVSRFIKVSNKEGQNNINGEKPIDYIISNGERPLRFFEESKLKWRYPCYIEDQKHQKCLPESAIAIFGMAGLITSKHSKCQAQINEFIFSKQNRKCKNKLNQIIMGYHSDLIQSFHLNKYNIN